LLVLDESNPRSLIYQVEQLRALMASMPLDQKDEQLSDSQRLLLAAYHELILAEPNKLADVISKAGNRTQLRRILQRLDATFAQLSQLLTATYFSHTTLPGSNGRS
ncbi:MAG: alpha-E domain-containing protein, partial [Pseudomonadota bacterium]